MSEPKRAQPQKLLGISPSFLVDEVVKTAEYDRDVLGFSFNRYWGEPPCFVILGRDSVEIFLSSTGVQGLTRPNRKAHPEVVWDTYVRVTDVEASRDELAARGADLIRGPESTFYPTREIEVEHCNGYVLCFSENVPQQLLRQITDIPSGTHKIRELSGSLRGITCAGRTRTPP
jgi:hypothetical protein